MLVGQKIGPFAIEKELGRGGMGSVYLAIYTKTGQKMAFKMMAPGLESNPSALARFERELSILKELRHPNIVRFYGHGRYRGTPFYTMEYIEGDSLEQILRKKGRFTWEEIVDIGKQLCDALHHAHEHGVIHRDIKPSNVMVLRDGTIKLTDFGIAKDIDGTTLTAANSAVGTAAYMSPEQCQGSRSITAKADLYAMGAMFYELLTGRTPFQAETILNMFQQHIGGEVIRPARLNLDIPVWLDNLICQMLEKKPEDRPVDAMAVGVALEQIRQKVTDQRSAGVEAVTARSIDRPKRSKKTVAEDMPTARTLYTAATGKKIKQKVRPFWEKVWFQAICIAALLLAVTGILLWTFQPPSANQLYQQSSRMVQSDDSVKWTEAREGPIAEFLRRFPTDPRAGQVREWNTDLEVRLRERHLQTRLRSARRLNRLPHPNDPNDPFEGDAYGALHFQLFGDLAASQDEWKKIRLQAEDEPKHRIWFLLAQRKIEELEAELPAEQNPREARKELVDRKLKEATDLRAKKKIKDAERICRDIVDLYQRDKDLKELVSQARAGIAPDPD